MEFGLSELCPLNPVEMIIEVVLEEMELMVQWAIKVPGFCDFDLDDQLNLFTAGKCYCVVSSGKA